MMCMRKETGQVLLALGVLLVAARAASAEPIRVLGGMTYDAAIDVAPRIELFSAERGFSLQSVPDHPFFGPRCNGDCQPGDMVQIHASWSGHDLPGMASLDGATFRIGIGSEEEGFGFVFFDGPSWTAPAFTGLTTATVVVPITFTGTLAPPTPDDEIPQLTRLSGGGVATLALSWNAPTDGWLLSRARYELSADAAPIPEPATFLLVGSGLAAAAWRRRRTTSRRSTVGEP